MTSPATIGASIKNARLKAKLTQQQLGNTLGTSQPYIAKIEANKKNLTLVEIKRIVDALDCKIEIILKPK